MYFEGLHMWKKKDRWAHENLAILKTLQGC